MKVVIIDYGAGNTSSVKFAFDRLGVETQLSEDKDVIQSADKVILPGVGHAKFAMNELKKRGLTEVIKHLKQDTLGVCLGMQLMCNQTEEGKTKGLGIFNTDVKRFPEKLNVPQVGWNQVKNLDCKLFNGIKDNSYFYFVHSYYVPLNEYTIGKTMYNEDFASSMNKNNFYACQFHPEKSGDKGQQLLSNFLEL